MLVFNEGRSACGEPKTECISALHVLPAGQAGPTRHMWTTLARCPHAPLRRHLDHRGRAYGLTRFACQAAFLMNFHGAGRFRRQSLPDEHCPHCVWTALLLDRPQRVPVRRRCTRAAGQGGRGAARPTSWSRPRRRAERRGGCFYSAPLGGPDIGILRASANDFAQQSLVSTLFKSGPPEAQRAEPLQQSQENP